MAQSQVETLKNEALALSKMVDKMSFEPPVHTVYNPLRYAWKPHATYLENFGASEKRVVFMGMNPGPWGMSQTGVPFGEIEMVKDWMGINEKVDQPERLHPKRPIEGFDCLRSEVSGRRLWGLFRDRYGDSQAFFESHFVLNYCPLVFMEETGRNRTPDKLPASERDGLDRVCDDHLRKVIEVLNPEWVMGVGKYAATQATRALDGMGVKIDWVLHPSPASPLANKDWPGQATKKLEAIGIW